MKKLCWKRRHIYGTCKLLCVQSKIKEMEAVSYYVDEAIADSNGVFCTCSLETHFSVSVRYNTLIIKIY